MRVPDQANSPPASGPAPARRPRIRQRLRTPLEARQWRRRMAAWTISALAFILVVNALFGENGYIAIMRAKNEARELGNEVRQVQEENQQRRQQIHRLRTDPQELEDAARKLQMSKPGEKMIILTPKTSPAPAPSK